MIINKKEDIQVKDASKITAFVNHHTASTKKVQFDFVDSLHKARWVNFKSELGFWGGYNFLIEKNGTIRQYRKVGEELAAHKGHNSTKGAVCLAGDFTKEKPTKEQEQALISLYSWLREIKNVPMDLRHGDLQWNKTSCPGIEKSYYTDLVSQSDLSLWDRLVALLRKELYKILKDKASNMLK